MERYLPRGSHSCKQALDPREVEAALRAAVRTAPLSILLSVLQPCQLFLVGGTVRDAYLNTPSTDLDLATDLSASEVRDRCTARGIRVIETGIQHGTVLAVIDDVHMEVTTFRQPADRNTQVNARDITTDLSGRDFTINALAFCLATSTLIDPHGGTTDIASAILRTVGDPRTRFEEDPLRILRMVRFGAAQGRVTDAATEDAAHALVSSLAKVSVERIRHELDQILMSPCPAAGVRKLLEIDALPYTIPELLPSVGFEQNRYHIHDVFDHILAVVDRTPPDRILRWAAIFHDIGKPHTLSVDPSGERHFYSHEVVSTTLSWERMQALKFSHDDMKRISSVVRYHMRPMDCGPAGVRRLIRDLGDNLTLWRVFKDADSSPTIPGETVSETARAFDALLKSEQKKLEVPSYGRLAVNGEDLKQLGIKPGPAMGKLLKKLEEQIIEDPSQNTKEVLLGMAKNLAAKPD
jgi:tRNA nucleotidyltransferase (CCA-adding enzyme)